MPKGRRIRTLEELGKLAQGGGVVLCDGIIAEGLCVVNQVTAVSMLRLPGEALLHFFRRGLWEYEPEKPAQQSERP